MTHEAQRRDAQDALNERHRGKEGPDRFPLMPEQEIDRRGATAADPDLVARLPDHRRREHDPAGRGEHSHQQRDGRQGHAATTKQSLHRRDQAGGEPDLTHRLAHDIDKQQQRRQGDEQIRGRSRQRGVLPLGRQSPRHLAGRNTQKDRQHGRGDHHRQTDLDLQTQQANQDQQ